MTLTNLFTWQFSTRKVDYIRPFMSRCTTLLSDGMTLTIAGDTIDKARTQTLTPPEELKGRTNIIYVSNKTSKEYSSIQEMILKEEPSIISNNGIVFTNRKN